MLIILITTFIVLKSRIMHYMDFPGGSHGKASVYNVGDPGAIPGSGRIPGEGMETHSVLLPIKSHGQRSLVSMGSQRV